MATRLLLAELSEAYQRASGIGVNIESVGGVDAARRVQDGELFDVVVLARDAIGKLAAAGQVSAASCRAIVDSPVAVAVRAGATRPAIDSEEALRHSVLQASRIGYSTGPSGTALLALFERWGLRQRLDSRLVQAPAGIPVAALLAHGEVDLGFQQLSELMHAEGIAVVGGLPPGVEIITTFVGAVATRSPQPQAAQALLDFLSDAHTAACKVRHGMRMPVAVTA
ncbi:MAG: substrate-binding domain-containing protein [Rhodocyclaceae bacterium]